MLIFRLEILIFKTSFSVWSLSKLLGFWLCHLPFMVLLIFHSWSFIGIVNLGLRIMYQGERVCVSVILGIDVFVFKCLKIVLRTYCIKILMVVVLSKCVNLAFFRFHGSNFKRRAVHFSLLSYVSAVLSSFPIDVLTKLCLNIRSELMIRDWSTPYHWNFISFSLLEEWIWTNLNFSQPFWRCDWLIMADIHRIKHVIFILRN